MNGLGISRLSIRLQAKKVACERKIASFTASAGWCTRFMARNNLCLRVRTKIDQKLPKQMDTKILNCQSFVIKQRQQQNFPLSMIGNMDETPIYFDIPDNNTVDRKGSSTVMIKTTGHEKTHLTLVLGCMANRHKLPPMIIFKKQDRVMADGIKEEEVNVEGKYISI